MSTLLYFAAALIIALGIAHSFLGEKYILIRLFRRDNLPKIFGSAVFTASTLRFAWHITTVAWMGFAALIVHSAGGNLDASGVLQIVGVTAVISGVLPLVFTRGKHLSWIILFVIGGLCLACA